MAFIFGKNVSFILTQDARDNMSNPLDIAVFPS